MTCSRCHGVAVNPAWINDDVYCHRDEVPSCYELAQIDAYVERQWHDAGRFIAELLGLEYDEREGFRP